MGRPHRRSQAAACGALIQVGGLSPRARGAASRLTGQKSAGGDHPRVRGEQIAARLSTVDLIGPSPRARGAGRGAPGTPSPTPYGTIPACAGSRVGWAWGFLWSGTIPACAGSRPSAAQAVASIRQRIPAATIRRISSWTRYLLRSAARFTAKPTDTGSRYGARSLRHHGYPSHRSTQGGRSLRRRYAAPETGTPRNGTTEVNGQH